MSKRKNEMPKQNENIAFVLDEAGFNKWFLPNYIDEEKQAKNILQFVIVLPFQLRFPPQGQFSFKKENAILQSFKISTFKYAAEPMTCGIITTKSAAVFKYKTRVEMSYVDTVDFPIDDNMDFLTEKFNILLSMLNKLILAYIISTKDFSVYQTTKEMLEPICIYRIIKVDPWAEKKKGLFILHYNVGERSVTPITQQELEETVRYVSIIDRNINPFIWGEKYIHNAKRCLNKGEYNEAIISIQTSIEIFVTQMLQSLWLSDGLSMNEIEGKLEEIPFMSMIKKELHGLLGGNWNKDDDRTEVGQWYKHTYLVRNRIIHGGNQASVDDARVAIKNGLSFQKFVVDRLIVNKNKYSSVANYFIT